VTLLLNPGKAGVKILLKVNINKVVFSFVDSVALTSQLQITESHNQHSLRGLQNPEYIGPGHFISESMQILKKGLLKGTK
jgi:hypothetical protein